MTTIKEGDTVKHKNPLVNGGLAMPVLEVNGNQALCTHLRAKDQVFKDDWFNVDDLTLIHEGDGGFKD